MKYKALNDGYDFIMEDDLLGMLLKNRGVENPKKILNLDDSVVHDGMLFKNIDMGLKLLENLFSRAKKQLVRIHIIVDSDVDGMTSACLTYKYLTNIKIEEELNIEITYNLHEGKQHGIILSELKNIDFDLLIVPDAGTNDVKECKALKEMGKQILILDHHKFETENDENKKIIENPYAIVINCQDGQYRNNTLAGVGVAYKFFKECDKRLGYDFADEYLDLVALGMVADHMDLRDYETRHLVLKGIKCFGERNLFLKELVEGMDKRKQGKINIVTLGWDIAPPINGAIREGTLEEKTNVFRAMLGESEVVEYQPRRKSKNDPKPPVEYQSLQKAMVRICKTLKGRQDKKKNVAAKVIDEKIKEKRLDENKVLMVDCTDLLDSTFTGLVANKLAEQYKRPVILLRKKKEGNGLYGGSCRNYNLSPIVSFQDFLRGLDTFNSLAGHDNSFGFEILKKKLILTRDKINEILKDMVLEDVYKVDYEIPVGRLKEKHIKQVGQWEDLWGNTIEEPLFAITDIYLSVDDIKCMGDKKNIIRFDKQIGSNKITFVKFFANEDVYNNMILKQKHGLSRSKNKKIKMDVIGKFKINKWEGNEYPQIEIIDFNSTEDDDFVF